jgi:hypothetical protein
MQKIEVQHSVPASPALPERLFSSISRANKATHAIEDGQIIALILRDPQPAP